MNTLDLIILVVVLVGLVRGLSTGGIKQVLSLAGVVIAFIGAARLSTAFGDGIAGAIGVSDRLAPIVSFVIVFFAIQLAAFGLARLLETFLKTLKLGFLNNIAGAALGGFKAVLVVSLVLFLARFVGIPGQEVEEESLLYGVVSPILPATWKFVAGRVPDVRNVEKAPEQEEIDEPEIPETESQELEEQ